MLWIHVSCSLLATHTFPSKQVNGIDEHKTDISYTETGNEKVRKWKVTYFHIYNFFFSKWLFSFSLIWWCVVWILAFPAVVRVVWGGSDGVHVSRRGALPPRAFSPLLLWKPPSALLLPGSGPALGFAVRSLKTAHRQRFRLHPGSHYDEYIIAYPYETHSLRPGD